MFRNVVTKGLAVGAGATVAGANTASTSHCRAQPTAVTPGGPAPGGKAWDQWLVPELDDSVADGVVFHSAEIDEAINDIMSLAPMPVRTRASSVVVTEVDSDNESVGSSANNAMEEADRAMSAALSMKSTFTGLLSSMLANPSVQRECMNALRDNPNFSRLLEDVQQSGGLYGPIEINSLLPAAAQSAAAAMDADDKDGAGKPALQQLLDAIGEGIKQLGHKLSDGCGAVGDLLITLGFRISSLLRRTVNCEGHAVRVGEVRVPSPDAGIGHVQQWISKVLITVACAVVALIVMRRITPQRA